MSTIKLNKGDYIQDPILGEWRFAMVTRNVEIDTVDQFFAEIPAVWVDEHLSGQPALEICFNVLVPDVLNIAPVEMDTIRRYMGTLFDEMKEKMTDIICGHDIIPFDDTDQGYDEGDISVPR